MWTNKVLPPTSCMLITAQRYTPSNGNSYLCLCPEVHCFFHIHISNLSRWAQTGWRGWPFRGWRWCWCDEAHAEGRLSRISLLLAAPATGQPGAQLTAVPRPGGARRHRQGKPAAMFGVSNDSGHHHDHHHYHHHYYHHYHDHDTVKRTDSALAGQYVKVFSVEFLIHFKPHTF